MLEGRARLTCTTCMRTNNIGIMAHVVAACLLSNRDSCVGPCYGPCFCVLVLALNQISVVTDSKRPPNMGNPALLYCPNFDVVDRKVWDGRRARGGVGYVQMCARKVIAM